jgi:hypothetical protein
MVLATSIEGAKVVETIHAGSLAKGMGKGR